MCKTCRDADRRRCLDKQVQERDDVNFIELMRKGITKCGCRCHIKKKGKHARPKH